MPEPAQLGQTAHFRFFGGGDAAAGASRDRQHDRLGDLMTELEAVHGSVSEEELAAARAEWPDR